MGNLPQVERLRLVQVLFHCMAEGATNERLRFVAGLLLGSRANMISVRGDLMAGAREVSDERIRTMLIEAINRLDLHADWLCELAEMIDAQARKSAEPVH